MEPPSVQYATTRDGLRIAFTVFGEGPAFVALPSGPSHMSLGWRRPEGPPVFGPSARSAALLGERFRVVTFDRRGAGLSTRGLGPDHSYEDCLLDIDAVVNRLSLGRFILYGALHS